MKRMHIQHRFNSICEYFPVSRVVRKGQALLAGGCIRSYLQGEEVADYDLFFTNVEHIQLVEDSLRSMDMNVVFRCPLGHLITLKDKEIKVQLITEKTYLSPEALLESFDFTITQFATDGVSLWTSKQALRDTRDKILRINKLEYPTASMGRIPKYVKRGYRSTVDFRNDFLRRVMSGEDVIDNWRGYID